MPAWRVSRPSGPMAAPGSGRATRPSRRIAWESSTVPGAPTFTVPAKSPVVARTSTATASSSWSSWTRASKPSAVGTTGIRRKPVSSESIRGPMKLVNRSTATSTSGRRRVKDRT